jgi:hypothetical protein
MRDKGLGLAFDVVPLVSREAKNDPVNGQPGGLLAEGNAKGENIIVLTCDFGKTFSRLGSTTGTNFLYADPGRDGETANMDTVNAQAYYIAQTLVSGGTIKDAQAAAQKVFDSNPYGAKLDGERMVLKVLPQRFDW